MRDEGDGGESIVKEPLNKNLGRARKAGFDEFYTRLPDIEKELRHYKDHFKDKTVFLNCDDPFESNFFKYFAMNFNHLELKKLISVSYEGSPVVGDQLPLFEIAGLEDEEPPREPYKVEITEVPDYNQDGAIDLLDVEELLKHEANSTTKLKGDGDFRSDESIELLKESDVIITNPPFSLFREYVAQLMEYEKDFLILGSQNAITYRDVFPYLLEGRMWLGGYPGTITFLVPDDVDVSDRWGYHTDEEGSQYVKMRNIVWYTNLDHSRRHEEIPLFRKYEKDPSKYPTYDNYDAIEVGRVANIPVDWEGVMGVPITFLGRHNPDQFELVGLTAGNIRGLAGIPTLTGKDGPYIDGKLKYGRILIRRKQD